MTKHKETIEIDFLYWGTIQDFANDVDKKFYESLQKASNLAGELEGRLSHIGSRGESLELAGNHLYHGNITIQFEYTSEKPLPELVNQYVLPDLLEAYIFGNLRTDKCITLKNMYSSGYILMKAEEIKNINEDVTALLKRTKKVPPDFIKDILLSKNVDSI